MSTGIKKNRIMIQDVEKNVRLTVSNIRQWAARSKKQINQKFKKKP